MVFNNVPPVQKHENKMFFVQTNKVLMLIPAIDPLQWSHFGALQQNCLSAGKASFKLFYLVLKLMFIGSVLALKM